MDNLINELIAQGVAIVILSIALIVHIIKGH